MANFENSGTGTGAFGDSNTRRDNFDTTTGGAGALGQDSLSSGALGGSSGLGGTHNDNILNSTGDRFDAAGNTGTGSSNPFRSADAPVSEGGLNSGALGAANDSGFGGASSGTGAQDAIYSGSGRGTSDTAGGYGGMNPAGGIAGTNAGYGTSDVGSGAGSTTGTGTHTSAASKIASGVGAATHKHDHDHTHQHDPAHQHSTAAGATQNTQGGDSTVGKLMQKAGEVLKNEKMVVKGQEKREQKGYDGPDVVSSATGTRGDGL